MNDDEFVVRRTFAAPRELVWRCLTDPAELAHFWGPEGMVTPPDGIVVQLHPGGRFETLMLGEHGSYRMVATFTEVVPPERLGWIEPSTGVQTISILHDIGDGRTEVVIQQRNLPGSMRTPQAHAGFLTSLDRFQRHLAHLMEGKPA